MSAWQEATLRDVLADATPGFACGDDVEDGVLQFRMNNITTEGQLDLTKQRRVPRDYRNIERFFVQPGDVLFNATNSPDLVGKTAYFPGLDEPAVFSNHFLRLRPRDGALDGRYLARWLNLQFLHGRFKRMCRQWVNQATVGRDALLSLRMPLPPLAEQRRIAAILDKADALRAKRRAALKKPDELAQSIFLDMFGDPATNPKGWPVASLEDVILSIRNGVNREQNTNGEGWPITRIETISEGLVDPARVRWVAPDPALLADFRLEIGDILFSHINSIAHIGKTALYTGVPPLLIHGINLLRIRPNQEAVEPVWLLHLLKHDVVRTHFRIRCKPAVNQASLNQSDIRALKMFLPPVELQREFASRAAVVDKQRTSLQKSACQLDALFACLQHRAFEGEL